MSKTNKLVTQEPVRLCPLATPSFFGQPVTLKVSPVDIGVLVSVLQLLHYLRQTYVEPGGRGSEEGGERRGVEVGWRGEEGGGRVEGGEDGGVNFITHLSQLCDTILSIYVGRRMYTRN